MTDNRTNEPTPEQILVDEWIRQADRAKSMTGMDAIWFPDAKETLAALRANGLLSEGTPSEEQARAIRKLDNVQAILAGAQASVTDAVRELSLTSAALTAAQGAARPVNGFDTTTERVKTGADSLHVAPQEPSQNETKSGNNFVSLDPEKVADVLRLAMRAEAMMFEYGGYEWVAESDPDDCLPHIAHALCEAYTEGKLAK